MLRLATEGEPLYEIDTRELAPNATGYTVDTLESLRPISIHSCICCWEAINTRIRHLAQAQEVARLARIAVFSRPGFKIEDPAARVIAFPAMPVSASDIARAPRAAKTCPACAARRGGLHRRRRLYR